LYRKGDTPPCDGRTTAAVMVTLAGYPCVFYICKEQETPRKYARMIIGIYLAEWYNKHEKRVTGDGCPLN